MFPPFRPARRLAPVALGTLLCSVLSGPAIAQFTAGNLVVLQVGDGSIPLANTGNTLILREFTPAGAAGFSVTIPTTGATTLVASGNATSEGNISLSSDGARVLIPGYAASLPNATALAGSASSVINRAVGAVDSTGAYTRPFASATFFSANNPRGATGDATNVWGTGANDGVDYFGPGAAVTVSSTVTNNRAVAIQNGQLYFSTGSGASRGVWAVGSGTPTTSGTVSTNVVNAGGSASSFQFAFNPTGTVCYVADDRSIAAGGGIQKWTGSGVAWTLAYTLGTGTGSTVGARGLVVDFSGASPVVYATTAEGTADRVIRITDTGAASTATTLLTAGTNAIFRGLAFAPRSACTAPAIAGPGQPQGVVVCAGGSASFTVTATGTAPLGYQWFHGVTPLVDGGNISGALSANLTINPVGVGDFGSYTVTVTNTCGNVTSNAAVLQSSPTDSDADGTPDCTDGCPLDPAKIAPGICGCGVADTDSDLDGTPDCNDGCPLDPLKLAPGVCGCGVTDTDTDADGTADCNDGCPTDPAKIAPGVCGCGTADTDSDGDGTPDCNDGCPLDPFKLAPGACGCGVVDTDSDGDGTADCNDGCPADPLKIVPGACGCGVADTDTDGDGTADCNDGCPTDPAKIAPGICGCGTSDVDSDGDGTPNCNDGCPADPLKTAPGQCGCGVADTDSDGTADCNDGCPTDPAKITPGVCGCGVVELDTDGDAVPDCIDNCDAVANLAQADTDADGVGDACDNCVAFSNPTQTDCDGNSIGDVCDIAGGAPDCNLNGVPDACDLTNGTSLDTNSNGQPDECETGVMTFCFGDGTGTACPCGNTSVLGSGQGCLNSFGVGGRLVASGTPSLSNDSLTLTGSNMPNSSALYFQGTTQDAGGAGSVFGDGKRCAGGAVTRLGTFSNVGGGSVIPNGGAPTSVSVRGNVLASGIRTYQVWYRNAAVFCTASTFNLTNGVQVVWTP